MSNTTEQIERFADELWNKWVLRYEGTVRMTKDLFTLAIQDPIPWYESQISTLTAEVERLKKDLVSWKNACDKHCERAGYLAVKLHASQAEKAQMYSEGNFENACKEVGIRNQMLYSQLLSALKKNKEDKV